MKTSPSNFTRFLFVCFLTFLVFDAGAYDFQPGDWFLKPIVGSKVNVVRYDRVTRQTPQAGMWLGLELDYMMDISWGPTGGLHILLAPGFVDAEAVLGVKYRFIETGAPYIPYAAISVSNSFLFPTAVGAFHWNVGLKPALGLDYFVMRNFAVGLEIGARPSLLIASTMRKLEFSVEALLGITWRIE